VASRLTRRTFLSTLAATTLAHGTVPRRPAAPVRPTTAPATTRRAPPGPPPAALLQLAGSCVMMGWYGHGVTPELRALIERGAVGGLLVGRHNFRDGTAGLAALCRQICALGPERDAPPVIAADQEGGPVAHLSPPLPEFPSVTALGALDDPELTHRVGAALGHELRAAGVHMDLAPVLDVRTATNNLVVLNRVFGREPEKVSRHGRAMIEGLASAGVLACAKHFPGHGATVMDSHAGLPRLARSRADLEAVDLAPFRACAAITPAMMLAHVVYLALDGEHPATLSRTIAQDVLRDELGFRGVAITDDLQMAAITQNHPIEEAAERAMLAGCDLLLVAHSSSIASVVVTHLAQRAQQDPAVRARLEVAAARVLTLRRTLSTALPPNPYPVETRVVLREVTRRLAALPAARARGTQHTADPTTRVPVRTPPPR
jgi:beta-N-acetylhexosaminidase